MMYYLVSEHANVERRIVTEEHPTVQMHLKDANRGWDAERIIKWMWGIEKKSENICELIEDGDLIQHIYVDYPRPQSAISQVKSADVDTVFIISVDILHSHYSVHENDILAIYKPNSKGDYIKVWERGE